MRPDQIQYVAGGLPIPPEWGGLGGIYRPPDPRDRSVLSNPKVSAFFDAKIAAADLIADIGSPIYNQGSYPACASAGTCGIQSIDEAVNGSGWKLYDWLTVYHENGGNDRDGIDPQRVLADARDNGLPLAGTGARDKIVSGYAFVPQVASTFPQIVTACIAAGLPVGVAMLLPSPFGYNSGMARTQGYHWMCGVASDPTWVTCVNSWGDQWPGDAPRPGLCRIRWDYLTADNLQNGLCFAFTTQRAQGPAPPPPPPPPPPTTDAGAVLALVNQARAAMGAGPLALDARLLGAAQRYAQLMADQNWFQHNGPDGSTPLTRMMAAGLSNPSAWAENIAAGFTTPAAVMAAWMNSPPHKANILNPALTNLGVGKGVRAGSQWGTYWVEDFAAEVGPPPPPPTPSSVTIQGQQLSWIAGPTEVDVHGQNLTVKTS